VTFAGIMPGKLSLYIFVVEHAKARFTDGKRVYCMSSCLSYPPREEMCTFRQLQREIIAIGRACIRHFSLIFNDNRTTNRSVREKIEEERNPYSL